MNKSIQKTKGSCQLITSNRSIMKGVLKHTGESSGVFEIQVKILRVVIPKVVHAKILKHNRHNNAAFGSKNET